MEDVFIMGVAQTQNKTSQEGGLAPAVPRAGASRPS
jgi:hypothetical protein